MIFYKFTCVNQTKQVSIDKEFNVEMIKQDLLSYKNFCEEMQDDEIFLFMVQDEVNKLVFDVIFKKSLDKVNMLDGFAHKFIKSMGKSFEMINRNEISINSLYNDLDLSFCNDIANKINKEKRELLKIKENIIASKTKVKDTLLKIEEIEKDINLKLSKIDIEVIKQVDINEFM